MKKAKRSALRMSVVVIAVLVGLSALTLGMKTVFAADPCPGDIDCDGTVDGSDLASLAGDFGSAGCGPKTSRMVGEITMWSGEMDVTGKHPLVNGDPNFRWHICDGTDGTPDLSDRFVIGSGNTFSIGETGGSSTQTLTAANLPSHRHNFSGSTSSTGSHVHEYLGPRLGYDTGGYFLLGGSTHVVTRVYFEGLPDKIDTTSAGGHSHSFSGITNSVGNAGEFSILPPYYALAFIMYMGDSNE